MGDFAEGLGWPIIITALSSSTKLMYVFDNEANIAKKR